MRKITHTCQMLGTLLAVCLPMQPTSAAPIIFQFQATVGPLLPGNGDVQLPFALEEGSVINGLLTIDPDLGEPFGGNASRSIQPFAIDLSFDGFSFGAMQYRATAINDSGISDGPNAGPADFITLDCGTAGSGVCLVEPLDLPGTEPLFFGLRIAFAGDVSLLSEPTLPEDVDIWNGFMIFRDMRFTFSPAAGPGDGFFTTLSSFTVVPEPSSGCLLLSYLLLLQSRSWRRREQS